MGKYLVNVVEETESLNLFGFWKTSSNDRKNHNLDDLLQKYFSKIGKKGMQKFPYFIISNHDEKTQESKLFVGGFTQHAGLDTAVLAKGRYAIILVKPRLKTFWHEAIHKTKDYFYTEWLPHSKYVSLQTHYEYHNMKTIASSPQMEIGFAIEKKCMKEECGKDWLPMIVNPYSVFNLLNKNRKRGF